MKEKEGTHDMARMLIEEAETKLGRRILEFNKKDAMVVTGVSRWRIDQLYKGDSKLCAVDLARRMCVGG